jgi:hypothetical protein
MEQEYRLHFRTLVHNAVEKGMDVRRLTANNVSRVREQLAVEGGLELEEDCYVNGLISGAAMKGSSLPPYSAIQYIEDSGSY